MFIFISQGRGLVLGVFQPAEKDGKFILTPLSNEFNLKTNGEFENVLEL